MKRTLFVCTFIIIGLIAGSFLVAQAASNGVLRGKVRSSGKPVAQAKIDVQGSGLKAITGKDGKYRIANIKPGTYTVSCQAPGQPAASKKVTIKSGKTAVVNFALQKLAARRPSAKSSKSMKKPMASPQAEDSFADAAPMTVAPSVATGGAAGPKPAAKPKPMKSPPKMAKADLAEKSMDMKSKAPEAEAPADGAPVGKDTVKKVAAPKSSGTVKYLSADDSNSVSSPVIARQLIRSGKYVHPDLVRTYEFLNYYSFDYPAPKKKDIAIWAEMKSLEPAGHYSMQVAVRSKDRSLLQMVPMNVTFLLDTSGSMAGPSMDLAADFIRGFVSKMRKGDRLSLVTFNRAPTVLLDGLMVNTTSAEKISRALQQKVSPTDITNIDTGLQKAYEIASKNFDPKKANRVVLVSDGAANAGKTAVEVVARYAEDSDKAGIYLAGVSMGRGFNDMLMNAVTDKGRGAYIFLDTPKEIERLMQDKNFMAAFDVAVKDIRLKMVIPPGWQMKEFHGEQVSSVAADVVPQYLSPNDQMIYHLTIDGPKKAAQAQKSVFEFEAEYRPIGGKAQKLSVKTSVKEMLHTSFGIQKGDAITAYAEGLKKIQYPLTLAAHKKENVKVIAGVLSQLTAANKRLKDEELTSILKDLSRYKRIVTYGEEYDDAPDLTSNKATAALGLRPQVVKNFWLWGPNTNRTIKTISRFGRSTHVRPLEGKKILALGSGPIGNPTPAGGSAISGAVMQDPMPAFLGQKKAASDGRPVYDMHQVIIRLKAPSKARSFSFDFNYFSAEYPGYVNANYNDTFYAIVEAPSTNRGMPTNISFDANGHSIEVDNNYFQNEFHPVPNDGTGFDQHGSTGWLRTSWPIKGGEEFTITFSIHDEGDGIFDSVVLLDNFRFNEFGSVGMTDPLN